MSARLSLIAISVALAVVIAAAPAFGSGSRAARATDFSSLYVTFHADKSVTMALADGTPVGTQSGPPTVIPPGTYNVLIDDSLFAGDVEWDLAGPGVKLVTSMSQGEDPSETWVETFLPSSTYTFRDDLRPPAFSSFVTSSIPVASSAGTGSAPSTSTTTVPSGKNGKTPSTDVVGSSVGAGPVLGTLLGTVSANGTLTLTSKGKAVSQLKAGRYAFTITDKSKQSGFIVQEIRRSATTVTSPAFVGKRSVELELKAGQWFYYPTFVGKKTYFIVVS